MKIKTSELTGPALDYAVAVASGHKVTVFDGHKRASVHFPTAPRWTVCPNYRCSWTEAGPIIERELIELGYAADGWYANMYDRVKDFELGGDSYLCGGDGQTPLIAAMRCYVASKLGDEVEIPEELG